LTVPTIDPVDSWAQAKAAANTVSRSARIM
jgi:hypothetical protein